MIHKPFALFIFLLFCLNTALAHLDFQNQLKVQSSSVVQLNFPAPESYQTFPSGDLLSNSIYNALNVEETQFSTRETHSTDLYFPTIHYQHFLKKIESGNNYIICEERNLGGASVRMNYSCKFQIESKWLLPQKRPGELNFIGPFAEEVFNNLSENPHMSCQKNFFSTQCQLQTGQFKKRNEAPQSIFVQICQNSSIVSSLNLEQLALNETNKIFIEKMRSETQSFSELENKLYDIWSSYNPLLASAFQQNLRDLKNNIQWSKDELVTLSDPYYFSKPTNCNYTPVVNLTQNKMNILIQKKFWNSLPQFDQNWILATVAFKKTLSINLEDKLRTDQWLLNLLIEKQPISFKKWSEQLYALGSQFLETPFLNSTAIISTQYFFDFSEDQKFIQKAFLAKPQSVFLKNQWIQVDQFYNLFSANRPKQLFIISPFTSTIKNRFFNWQPFRNLYFFENGQVEIGSLTLNNSNSSLRIQNENLNLEIIGGNSKTCEKANIQFNLKGDIVSVCGLRGHVYWNNEWIEISKDFRVDLKNEKEIICGTSEKSKNHPINEYSFDPLPSYFIPPCGGF